MIVWSAYDESVSKGPVNISDYTDQRSRIRSDFLIANDLSHETKSSHHTANHSHYEQPRVTS